MKNKSINKWYKWTKRYLLVGGVTLIGVPLWEYFLEEFAYKEIDLFFPGDCDIFIGGAHIGVLGIFHFITTKLSLKA